MLKGVTLMPRRLKLATRTSPPLNGAVSPCRAVTTNPPPNAGGDFPRTLARLQSYARSQTLACSYTGVKASLVSYSHVSRLLAGSELANRFLEASQPSAARGSAPLSRRWCCWRGAFHTHPMTPVPALLLPEDPS